MLVHQSGFYIYMSFFVVTVYKMADMGEISYLFGCMKQ